MSKRNCPAQSKVSVILFPANTLSNCTRKGNFKEKFPISVFNPMWRSTYATVLSLAYFCTTGKYTIATDRISKAVSIRIVPSRYFKNFLTFFPFHELVTERRAFPLSEDAQDTPGILGKMADRPGKVSSPIPAWRSPSLYFVPLRSLR